MAERGAGGKMIPLDPYRVTMVRAGMGGGIVTNGPADWFGPLDPQPPSAPAEIAGRAFDYPAGFNLNLEPRANEAIKFSDLRALADSYDLIRLLIETRKDQVARLTWNIKLRAASPGSATAEQKTKIAMIEAFLRRPDGVHFWDTWLRILLEDLFVIDAPTLYLRRTRGGALCALEPIDGATIKRVIDDWGRTPAPPAPAYQQVLHGLPAVDYQANDLIYAPRNIRAHKVYGYSPVEQVVMTVNIALRRQIHQLQYFTEGNVPEALIGVPDSWTPDQADANWLILGAVDEAGKMISNGIGAHGQCRLGVTNTTTLALKPYNGRWIVINGVPYALPSSGITATSTSCTINGVAGSSLTANTLYYVYVFNNAGTLTLDFSTTGHVTDSSNGNIGVEIKSGDNTRTLVGMIAMDASAHFRDDTTFRGTANWFNRARKITALPFTLSSTTSSSLVLLANTIVNGLNWADESIDLQVGQVVSNASVCAVGYELTADGLATVLTGFGAASLNVIAGAGLSLFCGGSVVLTEGLHTYQLAGSTTAGTANFNCQFWTGTRL